MTITATCQDDRWPHSKGILPVFLDILKDGGEITSEVTGKRKKAKGLEVPCVYTFTGSGETIIKLQTLLNL